ncbi:hypothetical protein MLD38_013839 [Melastoma candidum]|uniref:Uncharacterized protein n=1 Tax=Melastoma candidum TaxID=119954 RepID=A0ACB9RBG3_9MYRT|nr:hypothetical protein MLD38_013839 [Melastoma candidum]
MGKGGGCVPSKKSFSTNGTASVDQVDALQISTRKLKIFIVFYSMYGHVEMLARRIKKGVDSIEGVEGLLFRVPETLPGNVLDQMMVPRKEGDVGVISAEELTEADGLLFGFPTRYGCMATQMKAFFDATGGLWKEQRLAGIPAGFFISTGTQGGGQETTARVFALLVLSNSICLDWNMFVSISLSAGLQLLS